MTDLSQYSDEQLMGMLSQQKPVDDPNDVAKSYAGGMERGVAGTLMIAPNLLNAAAEGPQMLYRGIRDTFEGNPTDNSSLWHPFYGSEDALKMLPESLQPHNPTTPGGEIANISGNVLGSMMAGTSPSQVIRNNWSDLEAMRLGKILNQNDVPVYTSDVLQEGAPKGALDLMSDLPFSGKAARATAQQQGLNSAVARQMGMDSDVINPPMMKTADSQSGDVFKYLGDNYNISPPQANSLINDLASMQGKYQGLDPRSANPLNYHINDILDKVGPNQEISGTAYSQTRSDLGRLARSTSDPQVEMGAYEIQRRLDDAIAPSIPQDMQKVFSGNRQYYRNMLATEPAVKAAIRSGDISPGPLQQGVSKVYPNYIYDDSSSLPQITQGAQLLNKNPAFSSTTPMQRFVKQYGWGGDAAQAGLLAASPVLGPLARVLNSKMTPADFNPDYARMLGRAMLSSSDAGIAQGAGAYAP